LFNVRKHNMLIKDILNKTHNIKLGHHGYNAIKTNIAVYISYK